MIGIEHYTPTPEQAENMGRIAFTHRCNKLIYKKVDDKCLAYHPACGRQGYISKKILSQAKYSHLCPFCCNEIESTTAKTYQEGYEFVRLYTNADECFGFYVEYIFELGKEFWTDNEQVYYASGNDCYHKYIGLDLFANHLSFQPQKYDWHYSKRGKFRYYYGCNVNTYESLMWEYEFALQKLLTNKTKKFFLESKCPFIEKSSQKKIAIDNLLTIPQLKFMKIFDINDSEILEKYKKYIETNRIHADDFLSNNVYLNRYYLDYLVKNKIDLGSYFHYLECLKHLGFKYDKPTDFKDRFKKVERMYSDEKDAEINVKINKRYDELPKYSNNDIVIEPFNSAWEIRHCGKELHNCIGGYVSRYATKQTDIYHLDLDGALKIAIEIRNNKLMQAYADNNSKCPADLLEHIKSFCNSNGFSLGNYA